MQLSPNYFGSTCLISQSNNNIPLLSDVHVLISFATVVIMNFCLLVDKKSAVLISHRMCCTFIPHETQLHQYLEQKRHHVKPRQTVMKRYES